MTSINVFQHGSGVLILIIVLRIYTNLFWDLINSRPSSPYLLMAG